MLTSRGLGVVLGDLAAMGFDARWGVLGASDVGAPHQRERIWIVAHAKNDRAGWREQQSESGEGPRHVADANREPGTIRRNDIADEEIGGLRDCYQGRSRTDDSGQLNAATNEQLADAESNGRIERRAESAREQGRLDAPVCGASVADACSGISDGWPLRPGWWQQSPGNDGRDPRGRGAQTNDWWATEPDVGRVAHGVAARVDRLKAIGNGQVPQCAAEAWRILSGGM